MNCVKVEKQNIDCDVFTSEEETKRRPIAAVGIVMSLLFLLLVFCHSAFVQSCHTYVTKNKKDFLSIECLPRLMFHDPWDAPTLNVSFKFHDNVSAAFENMV